MAKKKSKPKRKSVKLTADQFEIVGQFNDLSFEHPSLSFEEVARKTLGPKPFSNTAQGKKFEAECRQVFEQERKTE